MSEPSYEARHKALAEARKLLETRTIGGASLGQWTVGDLLTVADWLLGVGPSAELVEIESKR